MTFLIGEKCLTICLEKYNNGPGILQEIIDHKVFSFTSLKPLHNALIKLQKGPGDLATGLVYFQRQNFFPGCS